MSVMLCHKCEKAIDTDFKPFYYCNDCGIGYCEVCADLIDDECTECRKELTE